MLSATLSSAALLLAALPLIQAQTYTDCNPLSSTTCPSDAALGKTVNVDFTAGASSEFALEAGTTLSYGSNGAEFTIKTSTDAPTIASENYIFFGKVEVVSRAASENGIVSSFILESDDLDEIDWEWLGSTDTSVESNFFGKGNTTTYDRAIYHPVSDPIGTFHTYTIDWTADYVKWSIDGTLVRTLLYTDALALEGKNFPQTPMKVKLGNWVGCASAAANQPGSATYGTCQWAGGPADFSKAPFTFYVKSVSIEDYSCASTYTYGDESGDWQSIKLSGSCTGGTTTSEETDDSSSSSSSTVASTSSTSSTASATTSSSASSSTSSSASVATTLSTSSSSASQAASNSTSSGSSSGTQTTTSAATTTSKVTQATTNAAQAMTPKAIYGSFDAAVISFLVALGYAVL